MNMATFVVEDIQKRDASSCLIARMENVSSGLEQNLAVSRTNLHETEQNLTASEQVEKTSRQTLGTARKALAVTIGGDSKPVFMISSVNRKYARNTKN